MTRDGFSHFALRAENFHKGGICTNQGSTASIRFFPSFVSFCNVSKNSLGKTLNDRTAKIMSFYWNAAISRISDLTVRRFGQVFSSSSRMNQKLLIFILCPSSFVSAAYCAYPQIQCNPRRSSKCWGWRGQSPELRRVSGRLLLTSNSAISSEPGMRDRGWKDGRYRRRNSRFRL